MMAGKTRLMLTTGVMAFTLALGARNANAQSFNFHAVDDSGVTTYYGTLHDIKIRLDLDSTTRKSIAALEILGLGALTARKEQQEIMNDTNVTSEWGISTDGKVLDEAVKIRIRDNAPLLSRFRIIDWLELMRKEEKAKASFREKAAR